MIFTTLDGYLFIKYTYNHVLDGGSYFMLSYTLTDPKRSGIDIAILNQLSNKLRVWL